MTQKNHPSLTRRLKLAAILVAVAVAAVLGLSPTLLAQQGISDDRAREIALEHVPGTVLELEREDEDGEAVIEVEVRDANDRVHEITLKASDGSVLHIEEEDDDDEDEDEQSAA